MKILTTAGLTKLIQLIKSSFISSTDVVETQELAIDTTVTSGSSNLITSGGVANYHDSTKYDASNPNGFITGITSSDVTTALGYTPYNSTNPNGYQTAIQVNTTVTSYHDNTKYDASNPNGYQTASQVNTTVTGYHDNTKQNTITSSNKLSSDLVDDSGHTNKFVTSEEKTRLGDLNVQYIESSIPAQELDLSTITVSKEGATYGFAYNSSTQEIESQNTGIDNSFAYGKITFNVDANTTLEVSVYQYSEREYDYGVLSNLDQTLSQSIELDGDYKWAGNGYESVLETLTYDITAGTHFITFKYRKDSSSFIGDDLFAITKIKINGTETKKLINYDTQEEIKPDLSNYYTKSETYSKDETYSKNEVYTQSQTNSNFWKIGVSQTDTAKKIIKHTQTSAQDNTFISIGPSDSSAYYTGGAWTGRTLMGNLKRTFLLGTARNSSSPTTSMCGIGAHTWTDCTTGTGAAWDNIYMQPDGDKAVFLGGNGWNGNSGWFKVQNNNSGSAGFRAFINSGTNTVTNWRTILPNMTSGTDSIFFSPTVDNSSTYSYSVSIGHNAVPTGSYATNIGYGAKSGINGVALGYNAISTGSYSIQIGQGTNSTANTMNVGLSSSLNVQLLDSNGKIPNDRLNLTAISGYDGTVAQALQHDASGNLQWVNI